MIPPARAAARRRGSRTLCALLAALLCAVGTAAPAGAASVAPPPTIEQLVGQKLIVRMEGRVPSPALLGRIRRGAIGGVVLFSFNLVDAAALRRLTAQLQGAAREGGQPRLLIAVDQEGGGVRRIPWAPPRRSAPAIGRLGVAVARAEGRATGAALRALGINLDLAPVADVDPSGRGFMARAGRTLSANPARAGAVATAFALGLQAEGVVATVKHFPGIGRVAQNSDRFVSSVGASRADLERDLLPFRAAIAGGVQAIMLSNVAYDAYDPRAAAGWSHAIATTLLRDTLGFRGVTITDSLDGTAHARGVAARALAVAAARAGSDLLLLTGSEQTSAAAFDLLCAEARAGRLARGTLAAAYGRILALKAGAGGTLAP